MTTGGIIAVLFLLLLTGLAIWGSRGNRTYSDADRGEQNGWHGNDGPGGAD